MNNISYSTYPLEYKNWLSDGTKPIFRLHETIVSNNNNKHTFQIYRKFDVLSKFMLIIKKPDDINHILEARIEIGDPLFIFKLVPDEFIKISAYCYELPFIIECDSNVQMLIPLVAIQNQQNIILNIFSKKKCTVEILCEYYNISNINNRRTLVHKTWEISTNHGLVRILSGMIGIIDSTSSPSISIAWGTKYNDIHDIIYNMYYHNKILSGKSFKCEIRYNDVNDIIDNDNLDKIIEAISCEWNFYYKKNINGVTLYL